MAARGWERSEVAAYAAGLGEPSSAAALSEVRERSEAAALGDRSEGEERGDVGGNEAFFRSGWEAHSMGGTHAWDFLYGANRVESRS